MEKMFNVDTVHDTAGRRMIQTIEPFTLIVDWNLMTIRIMKEDMVVDVLSFDKGFSLDEYEKLLIQTEKGAEKLKAFSNGQS